MSTGVRGRRAAAPRRIQHRGDPTFAPVTQDHEAAVRRQACIQSWLGVAGARISTADAEVPLDAIALLVESMLLLRTDNRPAFVSGREGGIRTRDLSVPNRSGGLAR